MFIITIVELNKNTRKSTFFKKEVPHVVIAATDKYDHIYIVYILFKINYLT